MTDGTHSTWGTLPCLGLLPDFHTDPTEGGAPLVSLDGHWWWDGQAWRPVLTPACGSEPEQPAPAEREPAAAGTTGQAASAVTASSSGSAISTCAGVRWGRSANTETSSASAANPAEVRNADWSPGTNSPGTAPAA